MVIKVEVFSCFARKNYTASLSYAINHNTKSFFNSPILEQNEMRNKLLTTLNLK